MSSSRNFVTVDLRNFKDTLAARARATHTTISSIVREAVARELDLATDSPGCGQTPTASGKRVRLCIRLSGVQAERLTTAARISGLPRGAYLAGLIEGVPVLLNGPTWADHRTALVASNSHLTALSRSLARLTSLLREGNVQLALEYATALDTVADDLRAHLKLAAGMLLGLGKGSSMTHPSTPS